MKFGRIFSLIGVIILAYMLNSVGFEKIIRVVQSLNPAYMLGFFAALASAVVLKGVKWKASLKIFNIPATLADAIMVWTIGFFIGAITPGRIGDFAKIYYVKEKKSKTICAILLDRFTDIFAVVLFAIIGVGVFGSIIGLTYEVVLAAILALATIVFALKKNRNIIADAILNRIIPEKYRAAFKGELEIFSGTLKSGLKNRAGILKVAIMAIFIWMVSAMQGFFMAKSLEIDISYFHLILILSIVALLELIPVSVAGLGTREAGVVVLMSFLGIESDKALVFSLAGFIFGYLALAAAGYLMWLKKPIKIEP